MRIRFTTACYPACGDDRKYDDLHHGLLEHIDDFALRGILATVSSKTYKQATSHGFKSTLGNAYAVCAFGCALKSGQHVKELGGVRWRSFLKADSQTRNSYAAP